MPFGRAQSLSHSPPPVDLVAHLRAPEPDRVFQPRPAKTWRLILFFVLGSLCLLALVAPAKAGITHPHVFSEIVGAVLFFGLFVQLSINARRGLPRLTVTATGIKLETCFGTKAAEWNSLADFTIAKLYIGGLTRRNVSTLNVQVTGSHTSANLHPGKRLTIVDQFATPIAEILAAITRARDSGDGVSEPNPAFARAVAAETQFGLATFSAPFLTFGILAVLAAVFVAEQVFRLDPIGPLLRPSLRTLVALGGLDAHAVIADGQWYRIFTGPLLHADINHLVFNGIALLLIGFLLERLVGRVWFLAIFVIGAVGGALASMALNPAGVVSVGASGAIMAMLAAGLVGSFRLPQGTLARSRILMRSMRVLVPSLLPLATSAGAGAIDYGAHLGGAVSGALVGLFLIKTWPDTARLPRFRGVAAAIAVLGVVLFAGGGALVALSHPRDHAVAGLIPDAELPRTLPQITAQAADLVARYPTDPRAHLFDTLALAGKHDIAGAEREFGTAVAQSEAVPGLTRAPLLSTTRAILAAEIFDSGRAGDARKTAEPLCAMSGAPKLAPNLRKLLDDRQLCR